MAPYPTHVVTFAAMNGLGRRGQPGRGRWRYGGFVPGLIRPRGLVGAMNLAVRVARHGQPRLTPAEWVGILPDRPYIDSCS